MITNNKKPGWFFYSAWILLSSVSFPIAVAIYWVLISLIKEVVGSTIQIGGQPHITEDHLVPYILWPALGLVTGFLQYLLLRRYLSHIGWWVAATTLGWIVGFEGESLLTTILYGTLDVRAVWFKALMTALVGGVMGLTQWLVLHQRVRHASMWILANALSWGVVGWGQAALSNQMVLPAVGILLVPGLATSLALWILIDRLPNQRSGGMNMPPNNVQEITI